VKRLVTDEESHPDEIAGKIIVLYPTKPWQSVKVKFYNDKGKCTY
jgi:hypothetical protein